MARFSGKALASHDSGASRAYCIDANNHVQEFGWEGTWWAISDLTLAAVGNAPPAAFGSALASHDSSGSRVYFTDSEGHVHELASTAGAWNTTDLILVAVGTAPAAAAGSALTSHDSITGLTGSRVYFIDDAGHVHELAVVPDGWNTTDLTLTTGAPPAAAGSALASHDSSGSRVYFTDDAGHVHELAWVLEEEWNTSDLTLTTGAPPAAAGSALASHDYSGSRVYFTDDAGHVHELAWVLEEEWNTSDLTLTTGAPSAAAGSALASHVYSGSRVYFISADDHVHELAWVVSDSGPEWNTTDLTLTTGAPSAAAGSALAFHDSITGTVGSRVYFISADNHVHELATVPGGWNTTDLTIQLQPTYWMKGVDPSKYLCQLSIPETHDTLTFDGTLVAQDQDIGIAAQLDAGNPLFRPAPRRGQPNRK